MKLNVVTTAIVAFDWTTARTKSWYRQGFVRLISIQCDGCGCWVDVSIWDPQVGSCDWCAARKAPRKKLAARYKRRGRRFRSGGAR